MKSETDPIGMGSWILMEDKGRYDESIIGDL